MLKFKYTKRKEEDIKGTLEGNDRKSDFRDSDFFVKKEVSNLYRVEKISENQIRICPPTWNEESPIHWAIEIYHHYFNDGTGGHYYLCNKSMVSFVKDKEQVPFYKKNMKDTSCPFCDEVAKYKEEIEQCQDEKRRAALTKAMEGLYWKRYYLAWIIDRKAENPKPQLFKLPQKLNNAILGMQINKFATKKLSPGEVLSVEDPFEGRDVYFEHIEEPKPWGDYSGIQLVPDQSPLSEDKKEMEEWLKFIVDNPLPEVLQWYSYDHMKKVMENEVDNTEETEEIEEEKDEIVDYDAKKSKFEESREEKSNQIELSELDRDDLLKLAKRETDLTKPERESMSDEELKEAIYEVISGEKKEEDEEEKVESKEEISETEKKLKRLRELKGKK